MLKVLLFLLFPGVALSYSKCSTYVQGNLELKLTSTSHTCEINGENPEEKIVSYEKGSISNGRVYIRGGSEVTFEQSLEVMSGGFIVIGGITSVVLQFPPQIFRNIHFDTHDVCVA